MFILESANERVWVGSLHSPPRAANGGLDTTPVAWPMGLLKV